MFGTCAGAILLGRGDPYPERLGLVPVTVRRNAYGRQRESFEKRIDLRIGGEPHLCVFIRAPKFEPEKDPEVEVLGNDGTDPILIRYRNFLLSSFHPELTADLRIHQLFLGMCEK
jgi:5'-phosphate synthase pdxT subunit